MKSDDLEEWDMVVLSEPLTLILYSPVVQGSLPVQRDGVGHKPVMQNSHTLNKRERIAQCKA